jgi:hypothetical protein
LILFVLSRTVRVTRKYKDLFENTKGVEVEFYQILKGMLRGIERLKIGILHQKVLCAYRLSEACVQNVPGRVDGI